VHTRWIETEFDNTIAPFTSTAAAGTDDSAAAGTDRRRVTVEVGGRRLEVVLPAGLGPGHGSDSAARPRRRRAGGGAVAVSGDALTSPMQGTIVKLAVSEGQQVGIGDLVLVLEAMKMEQPLTAHRAGTVTGLTAQVGATVASGSVLCEIKD